MPFFGEKLQNKDRFFRILKKILQKTLSFFSRTEIPKSLINSQSFQNSVLEIYKNKKISDAI